MKTTVDAMAAPSTTPTAQRGACVRVTVTRTDAETFDPEDSPTVTVAWKDPSEGYVWTGSRTLLVEPSANVQANE